MRKPEFEDSRLRLLSELFSISGVVPKQTSKMAENGPHEEGSWKTSAKLASTDLLGAATDHGRDEAAGKPEKREENIEAA